MNITRRLFVAATSTSALAACAVTSNNGVTTLTVDTAAINTRGGAIVSALTAVLGAPSIIVLLGPNLPVAAAALAAARVAMQQIADLTNGKLTVTADTTKVAALVMSIVTDTQTILTLVETQMVRLQGSTATTIGNYIAAVLTLLPLLQVAAGLNTPPAVSKPLMSEHDALRIANHK